MPPRKMPRRKLNMRKAKRIIAKGKRAKAKKNLDTFFLRATTTAMIVPAQGSTVANYVYLSLPLIQTSAAATGILNNTEFTYYSAIYDKVRINNIRIRLVPKANVLDQANATNDGTYNLTGGGVIHHAIDRNGPITSSVPAFVKYPSYRKTSLNKTVVRNYKVSYPKGSWLNTASGQGPFQGDAGNIALMKTLGLNGGISLYAENLIEDNLEVFNEPYASLTITYDCVFQGKTGAALKANDDGTFTFTPYRDLTPASQTPLIGVSGSLTDSYVTQDLSGAMVDNARQYDDVTP